MARPAALPAAHYVIMRRLRRSFARRKRGSRDCADRSGAQLTLTTAPRPAAPAERPARAAVSAAIAEDIASAPPLPPDRMSSRRLQIADNARGRGFHFFRI